MEVRHRIQAGANARISIEVVMIGRNIVRKLKGMVLDFCVVPASRTTYDLKTAALSELKHHKLQVCEYNWLM